MIDVVVTGAGPAGCALAGLLARRGHSVTVVERERDGVRSVGETLGGEVPLLIDALGSAELSSTIAAAQVPFRGVRTAWGQETAAERPSILHPLGAGWHVDRARFDAALRTWAAAGGARLLLGAGAARAARSPSGFVVTTTSGARVEAGCFVDASGRGAPVASGLDGARWLSCDRQVGIVARTAPAAGDGDETELLLEAVEGGWWYSVPQPDRTLLVVLITDADLVAAGARSELDARFRAALQEAPLTMERAGLWPALGRARVVRADTGCLAVAPESSTASPAWHAVGDAAFALDPLSGQGVASALRRAADVAAHIGARLRGEPVPAPEVPWSEQLREALEVRARYHLLEARWPRALFWMRRRPVDWRAAPLALDPERPLRRDTTAASATARAEALIPRSAVAALLARARDATPAHALLGTARDVAPVGDRRLLVGLQLLVDDGALVPA